MDFATLGKRIAQLAVEHSPTIMTGLGVAGSAASTYLAGKASFRVANRIRDKEDELQNEMTLREKLDYVRDSGVWRAYVPAGLMLGVSVAAIIGANRVGVSRTAAMAAAYSLADRARNDYEAAALETVGPKREGEIRENFIRDRIAVTYTDGMEIPGDPRGELCYDVFGDRPFRARVDDIKKAENELNAKLHSDGYASLAEAYKELGLEDPPYAQLLGWRGRNGTLIHIQLKPIILNDKPWIGIEFSEEPYPDYGRASFD